MNYGNLVRRPFDIVARRPYLWLLGFLAGGATTFNFSNSSNFGRQRAHSGSYDGPSWAVIQNLWNQNWEWIVAAMAFFVIVAIVLFVLGCIATGGIIHAAVEHDEGRDYRLGTAWRAGYATGWRIAGLRILTFLLAVAPGILVGALVVGAVAAAASSPAAAVAFGLPAVVVFLAALGYWLVLSVAYQLGQRIVVLEGGHVAESLSNGFRMVGRHLWDIVLGFLLLIAVSIGFTIAMAILAVLIGIPAVAFGFAGWAVGGTAGAVVLGTVAAVYFVGVLIAAGAAYSAYSSVYWTLLFRSLRSLPEPAPRGAIVPAS